MGVGEFHNQTLALESAPIIGGLTCGVGCCPQFGDPKPTVPLSSSREGFLAAPPTEKVSAVEGYLRISGLGQSIGLARRLLIISANHCTQGREAREGVRRLFLQRNRLTLTAVSHEIGEEHQRRLIWERVLPAH